MSNYSNASSINRCPLTSEEFNLMTDNRYYAHEYNGINDWVKDLPIHLTREQVVMIEDKIQNQMTLEATNLLLPLINASADRKRLAINQRVTIILLIVSATMNILWFTNYLFG